MNQKGFGHLLVILLIFAALLILILKLISSPKPTANNLVTPQADNDQNKLVNTSKNITSTQTGSDQLQKYLTVEASLLGVSDSLSLYYRDLIQGNDVSLEPSKSWIPASTIKAYVVLEAFRQRGLGLISFDSPVTIDPSNVVPTELETDDFPRLREGTTATIGQLVEAMVIQSDNTAYNTLLDILDRRNINLALKNVGLTETVIGEKLNLDDNQLQADLQVSGRQSNTTTVKDLATYFDLLYNNKVANGAEMLAIFKRQKINNMIPALLPAGIEVAHKTGDWAPIYHDGGVVYKPSAPFVLTVFTNAGDPTVVAKLARVAYFQNADSVGKPLSFNSNSPRIAYPNISLAESYEQVLGEQTSTNSDNKFPTITAEDLGITTKDIFTGLQDAKAFNAALITPDSFLYGIKQAFLNVNVQTSSTDKAKTEALIRLSKDRLAGVKAELESGNVTQANSLLNESEQYLKQATDLAKNDPDKELLLLEIRQINDLHFAVLEDKAQAVPQTQKEQFIDNVYNFIKSNKQDVKSTVNSSVIANPAQQKPAIGTISQINNNTATLKFDDGTSKQVVLTNDTKVRAFQQDNYQDKGSLTVGDKIAILGLTNSQSQVIPQFILKNVPEELPNNHTGTVIEINPSNDTLKILDKAGNSQLVKLDDKTFVKSKDTNVTLSGIKAGSQVTVFGTSQPAQGGQNPGIGGFFSQILNPSPQSLISQPSTSGSPFPQSSSNLSTSHPIPSAGSYNSNPFSPGPKPSIVSKATFNPTSSTQPVINQNTSSSKPASSNKAQPPTPTRIQQPTLKATSITITVNSSGKHETPPTSKNSSNKDNKPPSSGSKSPPPPPSKKR